ncbi:MAG TPA: arylesterase [Rhizomicrobium sp.]|jgi:acyl-CoA thioesterase-1|nr:arylesterase [Rhizomicrobium sp.]
MSFPQFKRVAAAIVLFATLCGAASAAAPVRILMFGTSLTQGLGLPPGTELPAVLEKKLAAAGMPAKVINAGVSGDTSADGFARIDWSLADHPDAAIVELGSNDALRGLDPVQTEKNIGAVLAKLQAAHVPVLLLGMKAPRNLGQQYDAAFDTMYPKLAQRFGDALYPFLLDGVALDPKLNQADGIHPNPAGVQVIAARLFPYVKKLAVRIPKDRR